MRSAFLWSGILIWVLNTGCTAPSGVMRTQTAEKIALSAGWCRQVFSTPSFDITGFRPCPDGSGQTLTAIYFEGDGLAWLSRSRVSPDPTPAHPVGLKLSLRHPNPNVVYLSRPFQFGQNRNRDPRFWTSARFAPEVIEAYLQIIDGIKDSCGAREFHLVGYSGGGAIAALVAAKRTDVTRLVTVAGNLDHRTWTNLHGVSPLTESLNPVDFVESLKQIPQVHFYGGRDEVVPYEVLMSFINRFPQNNLPKTIEVKWGNHSDGWAVLWPSLFLEKQ